MIYTILACLKQIVRTKKIPVMGMAGIRTSHGEDNIWYIINLVMRDNMRRMRVWQERYPFASLKH